MSAISAQVVPPQPATQDLLALKQVFKTVNASSCPSAFNFHMHTCVSDGQLQPEALAQQAIAIGLKGFAVTDHHAVEGYKAVYQYFEQQQMFTDAPPALPHLWTGIEITSELLNTEVHILGYAFDPDHTAMEPYLQGCSPGGDNGLAENVIATLHEAGGLTVLAHPVRYRRSPHDLIPAAYLAGIDGVEAYYAYNNPSPWKPSPEQTYIVQQLAAAYGLLCTCGTDTHGLSLLQRL
jgi:predicted metal-dependent phosphoesterase TrpH